MIWGFTGSRGGITMRQQLGLLRLLTIGDTLHHGRCIGADEQADELARTYDCKRVAHPGPKSKLTADTDSDEIREPKPFLERNRDIVDESYILIAAPRTLQEEWEGSGTWATIRYARKVGKPVIILDP